MYVYICTMHTQIYMHTNYFAYWFLLGMILSRRICSVRPLGL